MKQIKLLNTSLNIFEFQRTKILFFVSFFGSIALLLDTKTKC